MTAQIELVTALAGIKDPTTILLIIGGILALCFLGMVQSTRSSASGFQTFATDLAVDYRQSNQQYRTLAEQFSDLKANFSMLEIKFAGVVSKLAEAETQKKEVLEKVELLTNELAGVHKKLDETNKKLQEALDAKALTDQENIELKAQIEILQRHVDTLEEKVVLLQSTSPTVLGDIDL